jgi:carboxylate-amine ligase
MTIVPSPVGGFPAREEAKLTAAPRWEAGAIFAAFEQPEPLTVGLEEEVFLIDGDSLDLAPAALEVLGRLGADARFKSELPAAQIEIITPPCRRVGEAVAVIEDARAALVRACGVGVRPMCAGVHPGAGAEALLSSGPRYDEIAFEYGAIARRQVVASLQVHVAVGGAERSLAVHNALRSYLPELAALAANAPFHEGRDTALASVRPKLSEQLPRQGVPPPIASWEAFAEDLRWGAAAGVLPEPGRWWWELRPHVSFGTIEVRVPDAQTRVAEVGAIAAVAHCLIAWLAARHDAGEALPVDPSWRIAENRWLSCRDGVEGSLVDARTGRRRPTRERLHELLDELDAVANDLGATAELAEARMLVEANGAIRQRAVAEEHGIRALPAWLADCFCQADPG